jgi:hypothetical protein
MKEMPEEEIVVPKPAPVWWASRTETTIPAATPRAVRPKTRRAGWSSRLAGPVAVPSLSSLDITDASYC